MLKSILWCWIFHSLIISMSKGDNVSKPGDFVHSFASSIPEIESYVMSQYKLEQIADENNLAHLPENEKRKRIQKLLKDPEIRNIIEDSEEFHVTPECENTLYTTLDGTCNNLKNPEWGSAVTEQDRLLPAAYDGHFKFRKSTTGEDLPGARNISLKLRQESVQSTLTSAYFVFFGQFVVHDITLSPVSTRNGSASNCCKKSSRTYVECQYPIEIAKDDPYYRKFNVTCLGFTRSPPYPKCTFEKRSPLNKKTSYLDLSGVYGNNCKENEFIRSNDGTGSLRMQESNFGTMLPESDKELPFCPFRKPENCLAGGDERLNQHTMLTSMHTLFARWHNQIAAELKALNSHWDEDKIYQETRRIAVGLYQYIVYEEYLPHLISQDLIDKYRLETGFCEGSSYDDSVSATEFVEFSSAAMRLHSMVPPRSGLISLVTYSNTQYLFEGKLSPFVSGSCDVPSQQNDRFFSRTVIGQLYSPPGSSYGLDLASINILRGRDHGLPSYVDLVEYCLKMKIRSFVDLNQLMTEENVNLLETIYKDVHDIDAWVGLLMETHDENVEIGPTASTILAIHFRNLKFGDTFFFTHRNGRYPFTKDQLSSIRNFSMARFLCDTLHIQEVRPHPFRVPSERNSMIPCHLILSMNWTPWKEVVT